MARNSKSVFPLLLTAALVSPVAVMAQASSAAVPGSVVPGSVVSGPVVPGSVVSGSLSFAQGPVSIDGQPIVYGAGGVSAQRRLAPRQTLATGAGTADVLLAPGALLRLGNNTELEMVAQDASRTEVRLKRGVANITAESVPPDGLLLVDTAGGQTQILAQGLYTFNAAQNTLRVFDGEAWVYPGVDTTSDVKPVKVKDGHELALNAAPGKPSSFDRDATRTDLLPWAGDAETRAAMASTSLVDENGREVTGDARAYRGSGGYGGYGPYGFYGDSYGFGSPFGWGSSFGLMGYPFLEEGFGGWGFGPGLYGAGLYSPGFYGPGFYGSGFYGSGLYGYGAGYGYGYPGGGYYGYRGRVHRPFIPRPGNGPAHGWVDGRSGGYDRGLPRGAGYSGRPSAPSSGGGIPHNIPGGGGSTMGGGGGFHGGGGHR